MNGIFQVARRYEDIPFKEKGRSFDGVDCWGLIWLFYHHEFRITLPLYTEKYDGVKEHDAIYIQALIAEGKVEWNEVAQTAGVWGNNLFVIFNKYARAGDLILMRWLGGDGHGAIYLDSGKMLHVEEGKNVVVQPIDTPVWHRRHVGIFRHPNRAECLTANT